MVNERSMCPRPQYTDLTYMRGTEPCGSMRIIGNHFQSQYTSCQSELPCVQPPQYTDLIYMGGIRSCEPIQRMGNTDRHMANIKPLAKFEVRSSSRSDAIVINTGGQTHRRTDGRKNRQNFALIKQEPRLSDQNFQMLHTY